MMAFIVGVWVLAAIVAGSGILPDPEQYTPLFMAGVFVLPLLCFAGLAIVWHVVHTDPDARIGLSAVTFVLGLLAVMIFIAVA